MAAYGCGTPRAADCARVRIRPRLDSQCALHLADGRPGRLAGHAAIRPRNPARRSSNPRWASAISSASCPTSFFPAAAEPASNSTAITARIAKCLYPDSTVFAKGFEETALPDNFFDAAIGNIPFGNYPVFDPAYRSTPFLTRAIHDYFFAKSLDKVRAGGVMALITSRYTMDKQDPGIRRYLADRADLLGAIRLPNTAFKANAGTEVTTDILFLQKRAPGSPASGEAWQDLAAIDTPDGAILINEYFARHPEHDAGRDAA